MRLLCTDWGLGGLCGRWSSLADSRCVHLVGRKIRSSDSFALIRLNVGGAKLMVQVCPECHRVMGRGGVIKGSKHGSGAMRVREFRRFPGDLEKVWFEVQVI